MFQNRIPVNNFSKCAQENNLEESRNNRCNRQTRFSIYVNARLNRDWERDRERETSRFIHAEYYMYNRKDFFFFFWLYLLSPRA